MTASHLIILAHSKKAETQIILFLSISDYHILRLLFTTVQYINFQSILRAERCGVNKLDHETVRVQHMCRLVVGGDGVIVA